MEFFSQMCKRGVCTSETQDSWESTPISFNLLGRNSLEYIRNQISEGGDYSKWKQVLLHSSHVEIQHIFIKSHHLMIAIKLTNFEYLKIVPSTQRAESPQNTPQHDGHFGSS